jgi:neutral ceramidase
MLSSLMLASYAGYDRAIRFALALGAVLTAVLAAGPVAVAAPGLRAGAGRADITPPTGYPLLGWARGDARALGQHTRLFARALVLQRGSRRLALVAADLNMISGGLAEQAARRAGFDPRDVILSASHTHAGPTGYSNFRFKDSAFPTPKAPDSGVSEPDPLLYAFLVRRLALVLTRARADLAPAAAGWGRTRLVGVTANRSIEAHLADHGLDLVRGEGRPGQDPDGKAHTIDPNVDVLRVDRLSGGRRVPLGAWSTFANHGTVNRSTFDYYNADHHAAAARVFEAALRRAGHVPPAQPVVNVYGNSDAGDVSAGLTRFGPAVAEEVGRREAGAMLAAWRQAGARLSRHPRLDRRWTRVCFCGQDTPFGPLADHAVFGTPYLTGSEEGRGPLFDVTGDIYEGRRLASPAGVQGVKIEARADTDRTLEPTAVPLSAARIGDRLVVTLPGEATAELGRRTRAAVLSAARGGAIERVVLAGYANEYASYFTTPEEYRAQHYEGGTTVYGPASGPFLTQSLADLAGRLVQGLPAPAPHPFDPTLGLRPTAGPYPSGAARGRALAQPQTTERLGHAVFRWRGGESGTDRPLDTSFVRVQRRVRGGWRTVASDLGLSILWAVDDDLPKLAGIPRFRSGRAGSYRAAWEPPPSAPAGSYRFLVSARRYRLASRPFRVRPLSTLHATFTRTGDRIRLALRYPGAAPERDFTARPPLTGRAKLRVGGKHVTVRVSDGTATVSAPRHARVRLISARDRFGNSYT